MTSFARRETSRELSTISEQELAKTVEAENARVLGISGEPLERAVSKEAHALPQYNVGHARRVAEISDILRTVPGLRLAGNFLAGRSIGDCVRVAERVAEDLHSQVRGGNI